MTDILDRTAGGRDGVILAAMLGALTEMRPDYKWVGYIPLAAYTGLAVYHIIVAIKIWAVMHR